jgi:hypothetical protein
MQKGFHTNVSSIKSEVLFNVIAYLRGERGRGDFRQNIFW